MNILSTVRPSARTNPSRAVTVSGSLAAFLAPGGSHSVVVGLVDAFAVKLLADGLLVAVRRGIGGGGRRTAALADHIILGDEVCRQTGIVVRDIRVDGATQFQTRLMAKVVDGFVAVQAGNRGKFPRALVDHFTIGFAKARVVVENFACGLRRLIGKLHTA